MYRLRHYKDKIYQIWILIHEHSARGQMLRLIFFLIIYFVGRYPIMLLELTSFGLTIFTPIHLLISNLITFACCFTLQGFYPDIHSSLNHTIYIKGTPIIQMVYPGCTGLQPMIRLSFALLFYPIIWIRKIYLFPISWIIIFIATFLHFLLLIPIACTYPEWFNFAHDWLTRIIFYGFYFLCWILWEKAISFPTRNFLNTKFPRK